jgi:hypothetical protein
MWTSMFGASRAGSYYPKIQPEFFGPKKIWARRVNSAMVDSFPLQFLLMTWAGWVNRRQLEVLDDYIVAVARVMQVAHWHTRIRC